MEFHGDSYEIIGKSLRNLEITLFRGKLKSKNGCVREILEFSNFRDQKKQE